MGGVGEAGPRLARIVVELHEAEDQVGGHQLKVVRRVRDHVPGGHKAVRDLSQTLNTLMIQLAAAFVMLFTVQSDLLCSLDVIKK